MVMRAREGVGVWLREQISREEMGRKNRSTGEVTRKNLKTNNILH